MAAAALAFKCMEVAYMKIVYYKNSIISRDRHELETTLQAVHPGNKFFKNHPKNYILYNLCEVFICVLFHNVILFS